MLRRLIVLWLAAAPALAAQRTTPAGADELAAISARGRQLVAYDRAAWIGTDTVLALRPDTARVRFYIAERDTATGKWTVLFGRFGPDADTFRIAFRAVEGATPFNYTASALTPPVAGTPTESAMARAFDLVQRTFRPAERRPYNLAILPADSGRWFVYAMPAQLRADVWPLGGDMRYLISADGRTVITARQLHRMIVSFGPRAANDTTRAVEDFHIAVVDEVPEDTDVFFTMVRQPPIPHLIATRLFVYRITPDGAIAYLGTTEKLLKR